MNRIRNSYINGSYKPFVLLTSSPHYPPDRPFNLEHIVLNITPDFTKQWIDASAVLTFQAKRSGVKELSLDFEGMRVKSVSLPEKGILIFHQEAGKLVAELPAPSKLDEKFSVQIDYEGHPVKGLYFRGPDKDHPSRPTQLWSQGEDEDSHFWFPCIDSPVQKVTSEVIANVPANMTAISNGNLVDVKLDEAKGKKIFHWSQQKPHSTYLISLVVGEYVELKEEADGVQLYYYVYKGREEDAKRSFGETQAIMKFFIQKIGYPYPWDKYAQVVVSDFIFGGMENTSCTTLTDTTLHDEKAHLDFSSTSLVAHEMAHQWFGDLLTCKHWSHAWLNEGFATYFDALYTEESKGRDEFFYTLMQNLETYLEEVDKHYARAIVTHTYETPSELFDRHLYQKGSLVLNMVRAKLGDTDFWRSIQTYVKDNAFGSVETQDFARAIEKVTGINMDGFFEQWVTKLGHPVLNVEYKEENSIASLRVQQKQDGDAFAFDLKVLVQYKGDSELHVFPIKQKDQTIALRLRSKPSFITVDPEFELLKTLEFKRPKEMMIRQLESANSVGRIQAAQGLAKDGSLEAVEALRKALLDENLFWGVRAEVAKALGDIGTDAALRALQDASNIGHPKARRAVMAALGKFKKEESAATLSSVLEKGDASYFVEAEAARSLGKTRVQSYFELLTKTLSKSSWQEVIQVGAIDGLAELGDERALPLIKERTSKYFIPSVRQAATTALGKFPGKQDVYLLLLDLLKDDWFRVRAAAANALVELRETRAIGELEKLAEREIDGRVKRIFREAIANLRAIESGSGQEVKQLREEIDRLKEENKELRERLEKLEGLVRYKEEPKKEIKKTK
ncbi:MAG: M1 family aminopeptidase [Nitrososphaerota archaeon]